jgi:gas vesicle protein
MQLKMPRIGTNHSTADGIAGAVDDVKRIVSESAGQVAEQVANLTGQVGREAGKLTHDASREAGKLTHDAGREAGKLSRDLGADAAKLGREIASGGEEGIRSLGRDLRELGTDLRSLRVTRQRQGPNMLPGIALLGGLGTGLAAMFFFDPDRGPRRRAMLRDQIGKWLRIARERLQGRAEDIRNRSAGLAHQVKSTADDVSQSVTGRDEATNGYGLERGPDVADELAATDEAVRSEVGY